MYPSFTIGVITFSIVVVLGLWFYKRDEKKRLQLERSVSPELVAFSKFIYIFTVAGIALACGKFAFNTQFYRDNWKTNGKWMVYKTWGFIN